jgi:hypothetical protein
MDNVWVLLAHEKEALGIVPPGESLAGWKAKGWKEAIQEAGKATLVNTHQREVGSKV